jgi:hypothetical protein
MYSFVFLTNKAIKGNFLNYHARTEVHNTYTYMYVYIHIYIYIYMHTDDTFNEGPLTLYRRN